MYVFLAVLGFHCCGQTSATAMGGYSLVMAHGLVTVATSLPQHKLQSTGNSAVAVHRVSCLELCGVFLDQGSNLWTPAMAGGFFIVGPPGSPSAPDS